MSGKRPPAAASFFVGRGGFQHKGELGPWSGWILSYGRLGHDFDLGDACIPDTKRFKKELDAQRKTVFRSTLFPADKRLVKGSNMEELITEIAYLIKL